MNKQKRKNSNIVSEDSWEITRRDHRNSIRWALIFGLSMGGYLNSGGAGCLIGVIVLIGFAAIVYDSDLFDNFKEN